jgi:transposase
MVLSAVLGIDVSKAKLDVVLHELDSATYESFANDPDGIQELVIWFEKRGVKHLHACLEATGHYGYPVAVALFGRGYTVSVVNPARIKAFARSQLTRNKTDKQDAFVIAAFCEAQRPEPWSPLDDAHARFQAAVRHMLRLRVARERERGRLRTGHPSAPLRASLTPEIAGKVAALDEFLTKQIGEMMRDIEAQLGDCQSLKAAHDLLVTIPGIGGLTGYKILAELPNGCTFSHADQLVAYAGLSPRQSVSGVSLRGKAHISKLGNPALRKALYMPALVARRYNLVVKEFCDRLEERGKSKMAVQGAAMRKLLHIVHGVLKTGTPFRVIDAAS